MILFCSSNALYLVFIQLRDTPFARPNNGRDTASSWIIIYCVFSLVISFMQQYKVAVSTCIKTIKGIAGICYIW